MRWVLIAYLSTIPLATLFIGYVDEWSVDSDHNNIRAPDPALYIAGLLWPLVLFVMLPDIGRKLYQWRKERRERRKDMSARIEAEKQHLREERARSAALQPKRRVLDLRNVRVHRP
jgi:hypothetical protein